jgi:hypothetical protein
MIMSESEFFRVALHSYSNAQCISVEEFDSDLSRIMGVKKLIDKLDVNCSYRLVLNNLVILYNNFGNHATELLIYKLPSYQLSVLFPFLLYLNRLPIDVIEYHKIELDEKTITELRKI